MKIIMLLYKKFPPDIRVEKEAKALIQAGHEVFVVAKDQNENTTEYLGIKILNLKNYKLDLYAFALTFFRPLLVRKLRSIIKKYSIDVIHVHDLPLVKTGYKTAKIFDIPIIVDLHENYPAAIYCYNYVYTGIKKLIRNIIIGYKRYRRYERKYLRKVTSVILVVPEALERFKNHVDLNKCFIVSNTVDINKFKELSINNQIVAKYKDFFIVSYIGGGGVHRGIDTSIKSLANIPDKSIKLLIIGVVGEETNKLKNLARELKVDHKIEFIDWVPFKEVNTYISLSHICLVPHNDFEHTQTTIPHKLFQYMYLKKAVLVSSCAPLKRIVEETQAGMIFSANDYKDMSDKIIFLKNNPDLLHKCGLNGHEWTIKKYNWDIESKKLIKLYESLNKF